MKSRRALLRVFLRVVILVSTFASAISAHYCKPCARCSAASQQRHSKLKTRAVVLIVLTAFAGRKSFDGPVHDLMDAKHGGAQDAAQRRRDFCVTRRRGSRDAAAVLWTVVAKQGQITATDAKAVGLAQVTDGF